VPNPKNIDALILALPETAGSALYGMVDVLAAQARFGANCPARILAIS